MSDVKISIRITGIENVRRKFQAMALRSRTYLPIFAWAEIELKKAMVENFTAEGLPSGGWAPLSPQYASWKAIGHPGAPILVRTGRLFRAIASSPGAGTRIGPTSAQFAFAKGIEYAKFHQYGTEKMPKRQIVYEPKGFAREFAHHAGWWVAEGRLPT